MPLPEPSPEALDVSRRLCSLIGGEISREGGWISFARYMELALYAPGLGYYAAGTPKFGSAGDFVTAPEISPLFGRVLAHQFSEVLMACGGSILELGAGSGHLAADIMGELERLGELPQAYCILEVSPSLRARQRELLAPWGGRVRWLDAMPEEFSGVIFGNEVLDALPAHLLRWEVEQVYERGVAMAEGTGFRFVDRPLSSGPLLDAAREIAAEPGYVSEISLALPALVESLGRCLRRGLLLFVDYGFGRAEYYHPQRRQGTLVGHYRHRMLDDPFYLPGLADLTAHVDFTSVADAALAAGLQLSGYTSQAHFLLNAGITQFLQATDVAPSAAYLRRAADVQKLLSPAEMGELFKVIGCTRDAPVPSGFASGDRRHQL